MTTLLDDLLNMEAEEIWRLNERPDADGLRVRKSRSTTRT